MSNPNRNVKRICFANVYCKQTKVGSITHHSLHISFFVGWKTFRCFVFQKKKKIIFQDGVEIILALKFWLWVSIEYLKMLLLPWNMKKKWQKLMNMTNPLVSSIFCPLPPFSSNLWAFWRSHLWFWTFWNQNLYLAHVSTWLNENNHHLSPIASITSVQFSCSVVSDSATPWIAAHQASLSITNSRSSSLFNSTSATTTHSWAPWGKLDFKS